MKEKILNELKVIVLLALYFAAWIAGMMLIKYLILAEYHIKINDISMILVGALILSKSVLILEHVPLGNWISSQPAWLEVVLRTLLYVFGVFVVLLLEKAFEGRHEHHGFIASLESVFEHKDIYHVWLNFICVSGALFFYNIFSVIQRNLGTKAFIKIFITPLPEEDNK